MQNTKQKISLLLPSRGRVEKLEQLFNSIEQKTKHLNAIEVVLLLDDDDFLSHQVNSDSFEIVKIIQARSTMGHYNTNCLDASSGDIIILINDDMLIQTPAWDEKIRALDNQYPDKVYLAYPNDMFKGRCTFPVLSRKTCDLLEHPFPVQYKGAFIDTHLFDVFERLRKQGFNRTIFIEDLVFEHRHYRSGKAKFDDTYKNRNRFGDDQVFVDLIGLRQHNAKCLIAQIQGRAYQSSYPNQFPFKLGQTSFFLLPFHLMKAFLNDFSLPFKWRAYLTSYFFARTIFYRWFRA